MKLVLSSLLTLCLVVSSCGDPDPLCNERVATFLPVQLKAAIPYEDGDVIAFETSTGEAFELGVVKTTPPLPDRAVNTCVEVVELAASGTFADATLLLEASVAAVAEGTSPSSYSITVLSSRTSAGATILVEIDETGRLRTELPGYRAELELNGLTYADALVTEVDGSSTAGRGIERVYYSLEFGLLGVDFRDGLSVYRVDQ